MTLRTDGGDEGSLVCASPLDLAGGGLLGSRGASDSAPFGIPVGRDLVERWIVCAGGNCPGPSTPVTSYSERSVDRIGAGTAILFEYDRSAEVAARLGLDAGSMAGVIAEVVVGPYRCAGLWTGRAGGRPILDDALELVGDLAGLLCGASPATISLGGPLDVDGTEVGG